MLCLYGILEDNPYALDTLFASLLLSDTLPQRILFFSRDREMIDDFTYTFWKTKLERHYGITTDLIPVNEEFGDAQICELALTMMQRAEYEHGIYVEPQVILQENTIQTLLWYIIENNLNAVAPRVISYRTKGDVKQAQNACILHDIKHGVPNQENIFRVTDTCVQFLTKRKLAL